MNVMLDLETLDTCHSAVVLSIGAVAFNDEGVNCGEFYVELTNDLQQQADAGRTTSMSTLLWWMEQGQAAQQVFRAKPAEGVDRFAPDVALNAFTNFLFKLAPLKDIKVWGNGSDFDNVILADMYKTFGIEVPWKFYNNRCFRTVKNIPGAPKAGPREGVYHNALDDAKTQYVHLTEINAWLRDRA